MGPHARGERLLEPKNQSFVEDRVDRAGSYGVQAPLVARAAVQLETPAPSLQIFQGKAVSRERLIDQDARRVRLVFADRKPERVPLLLDLGERIQSRSRMDDVDEAVPRRINREHSAPAGGLGKQASAAVSLG
jgi:hypothetical protein